MNFISKDISSSILCCESCGSLSIHQLTIREGLKYIICDSCGHCLKVTLCDPHNDFNNSQNVYFGHDSPLLQSSPSLFDSEILAHRRSITSKFLPHSGAVIEVGPGAGYFAEWLKDRGLILTLFEHSLSLAEALRQRLGLNVEVGTFETSALPEAAVDVFFSFHVIEHVPDPLVHLAVALQTVRPGGYAFIATPNSRSFQQRLFPRFSPHFDEAHVRVFSPESLRNCCDQAGWKTIKCETPEFSSEWLRVGSKILRKLRGESESTTAGKYANALPPRFWWIIRAYILVTSPFRFLQRIALGGSEVLVILQRPDHYSRGNEITTALMEPGIEK